MACSTHFLLWNAVSYALEFDLQQMQFELQPSKAVSGVEAGVDECVK
jgi:hypothetical protein